MKNLILPIACVCMCIIAGVHTTTAQTVGISADPGNTANTKAILDLDGVYGTDYRGMLLPRMTSPQKVTFGGTLGAADEGMTMYNLTDKRYEFWDGTQWIVLATTVNVSSSTLDEAYDGGGSGVGRIITADAGAVEIQGNGGLYVQDNLGVGTSAPASMVEINAADGGDPFLQRYIKNSNTANELIGIGFGSQVGSHTVKSGIVHERESANGTGKLHFLVDNSTDGNDVAQTETRMTIDRNGLVGIGTTTPGAKLQVANTSPSNWEWNNLSSSVSLELGTNAAGNVGSIRMNSYTPDQFVFIRPSNGNYHIDATTGQYYFNWDESVRGSSNGAIHMANEAGGHTVELNSAGNSFLTGGNLGIGTATPAYNLDVTGNTRTTGDFFGDIHVDDTRNNNFPPTTYNNEVAFDFKRRTTIGVPGSGTYSGNMTFAPWADNSGDASHQINFNEGGLYWRQGQPGAGSWGSWDRIVTESALGSMSGSGNWIPNNGIGDYQIASSSTSTGYSGATLELRESNFTANGSATPPHLGFHWGGIVASNIAIESSGRIAIRDNPGTGYENLIGRDIYSDREIYVNNWVRHNDNDGTYWSNNQWHIYPESDQDMNIRSGNTGGGSLRLMNGGTARGYLHWTAEWQGWLNSGRQWQLRTRNDDGYSPNLYFDEEGNETWTGNPGNDEGKIEYHSNRFYIASGANSTYIAQFRHSGSDRLRIENSGHIYSVAGAEFDNRTYHDNGVHVRGDWLRVDGNNGLYFDSHGTGIHSVQADGGQYGSVNTYGNEGGWEGYSIDGRYVFMGQDNGQEWGIYNDVDNIWAILYNRMATDNGFRFFNSWSGALNMRIQHTNGGNYASYDGDSNWDFYSDRRLKEDIENEQNILDRLLKLDVVNYNFIDQGRTDTEQEKGIILYARKEKEIGFIAQEVEKYFPSLVSEAEDDRFDFKVKALGYSSFGVLAIGGIKELKEEKDAEIQELKAEVEELKNLVNELLENQK